MNFKYLFLTFIIYSILGWITEVINMYILTKKLGNRGFLIGPYCPIYGIGIMLVISFLQDYIWYPITLYALSILICGILEYAVSFALEKIFNTRWWDYSDKPYNLNGRICAETLLLFGIGCTLVMYFINPFIASILLKIPENILNIITFMVLIIFLIDIIISAKIIWQFKSIAKKANIDNTDIVTEYVKQEIIKKNKILYNRLINSFPKLKTIKRDNKKRKTPSN